MDRYAGAIMNSRGLRIAAIRLSVLHPSDRNWVLKQMVPVTAKALRSLLQQRDLRRFALHASGMVDHLPDSISAETSDMVLASTVQPVSTSASFAAELELADRLEPCWAALWLSVHAPECLEGQLTETDGERASAIAVASQRFRDGLPLALRNAVAAWHGHAMHKQGDLS